MRVSFLIHETSCRWIGILQEVEPETYDRFVRRVPGASTPARDIQAALAGLGIVVDDRERVGWRDVPARRDIGAGMENTSLISLTSEERRTRPHMASITLLMRIPCGWTRQRADAIVL
jgi:hypothetical protein